MSRDWEAQFRAWAKPPGKTEEERCSNAASAIRNAIKASDKLRNRGISIFAQGSYRNNTNVRQDSDVDIGMLFNIIGNPASKLEGEYWTQQQTTGTVTLTFRGKELLEELPANLPIHPMALSEK
jgi:tRNA nucleotidyltransferase (CCA-adding enzyme)